MTVLDEKQSEIDEAIEQSQKRAKELGLFGIVETVATKGSRKNEPAEAEWEGCVVRFGGFSTLRAAIGAIGAPTNGIQSLTKKLERGCAEIVMADETVLYRASDSGEEVLVFREGDWVGRITEYAQRLLEEKRLTPFSEIDF